MKALIFTFSYAKGSGCLVSPFKEEELPSSSVIRFLLGKKSRKRGRKKSASVWLCVRERIYYRVAKKLIEYVYLVKFFKNEV